VTTRAHAARRPMLAALPRFSQQVNRVLTWLIVALFVVWVVGNFLHSPEQFVSVLLLGITLGAIYALVALGYTLVYGIIELINFANGDVFMLGTMVTITVSSGWLGLNGCLRSSRRWPSALRSTSASRGSRTGRCETPPSWPR
jgi:ABC-type branched-subunit amino acid transport system permease subunit